MGHNTQFADYRAADRLSAPHGETLLPFPPGHEEVMQQSLLSSLICMRTLVLLLLLLLLETTSRGLCELVCPSHGAPCQCVCVYYCRTYYKAVCGGGGGQCGTREEPGTLTQGGALFSLVPLVWESNPKLTTSPSGDLIPAALTLVRLE